MKVNSLSAMFFLLGLLCIGAWFIAPKLKNPAPDLIITTITGKKIELKQLLNKPVIITFWATDCASCVKEIPDFIDLYNQFHTSGLEVIGIAMYYDIPSHVVEMTKAKQIPYHIALDLKASHALAFGQVQFTPTTFLISPSGHIIMQHTGLIDINNMRHKIESLLKG